MSSSTSAPAAGGPPAARRRIAVVPHTHWDREWYDPFQTFRLKLVHLIDGLLDLLERDPSYKTFLLDGQLAVIDDYLEIRPENEGRLRALASAGRLTVGPWYILMDEFLISGETIIRDLQAGIRRGTAFGGVMDVGYLPDMFGHIAQMPQILASAGLRHAVVWRGVPSAVDTSAFVWEAPDNSRVRAEYLVAGYGNGAALPDDAKALIRRLRSHLDEIGSFLAPESPLLFMNGTDHQRPQPWLGRVVAEANEMQGEFELGISSLPEYLSGLSTDGLPEWRGELRSGYRSNLLMGVGSNRVDVKQAAARSERSLERLAEPLSALYLDGVAWPAPFLDVAWKLMVRNAAHDSICACSVDEVVDAVLHRYAEARQIGEGLTSEAVTALGVSLSHPGTTLVNPAARDRSGMVELVVPALGEPGPDIQVISQRAGLPGTITLNGTSVVSMLGMIQGARIDEDTYVTEVGLTEDDTGLDITLTIGSHPPEGVPIEEIKRELFTKLTAHPDTEVRVTIDQPAMRRILGRQENVPGFGWAKFEAAELSHPVSVDGDPETGATLSNGLITVEVNPVDGTFSLNGIAGYGRLVDDGDHGDTYNYSPPAHDRRVEVPESVVVAIGDRGPVRGTVVVRSTYNWPERVDNDSRTRVGSRPTEVTTTLELRAEETVVRVHTSFDNASRDHRLRAHFPLREPAATSRAECAFTVVTRGLTAEGRDEEFGTPTFPSRRFVSAGGLTVIHEGLLEYELVDVDDVAGAGPKASALALTLLRSTGMLSRFGMITRPLPAGPMTPIEGPQMIGPVEAHYALSVDGADPYQLADDVLLPLLPVGSFGGGTRPASGSPLTLRGAEVSSVRREAGSLEIRVFNPGDVPTVVEVESRSGWLVDLRGRPLEPFDGRFELRPHGIATLRLD
ncbi:MAG TPA: glycoside hydrolase family 38 C-terminal domain-containing protein [Acidimicrobiales bacterium]|nr:glycoside hydrolase family 38 C-terminal domain-containing protein [Acidimicrobiales bacterium]